MPKISVIIPVYNTEKYLSRCLDSVVNQTFKDLEIICVNDGSTDNSNEILDRYASKDNRITVINQKNGGLSAARNTGLRHASGQYIGFVDSDDWIDIDYYECLIGLAERNNADIVMAGMRVVDQDNISDNTTPNMVTNNFVKKIKNLPNGGINDKLLKSELFQGLEFPVGRYYEDNVVLLKVMYYSKIVVFTNSVSYYYFMNQSGICRTTNNDIVKHKIQDRLYSARSMMDFAKEHRLGQSRVVKDFILRTVICEFISKKSQYYKQTKKILGIWFVYKFKAKRFLGRLFKPLYKN